MTQNDFTIRKASLTDLPQLQKIYAAARTFMKQSGNPHQWDDNYPSVELITHDINLGNCYVCFTQDEIVATFVLHYGIDETYTNISDGAWLNDLPYATIHRIASNGKVKGIMHRVMEFARNQYNQIRIDTHRDNLVMQHAILKEGFCYCGIIRCWNGSERLAYQYSKCLNAHKP